jgi:hypothetical protein
MGATGVGAIAGALLVPDEGSAEPAASVALVVGVLVTGVVILLVIAILVTIPNDRRTTNLVRVIRAARGDEGSDPDSAGPPGPPSDTPDSGTTEGRGPPRPVPPNGGEGASAPGAGGDGEPSADRPSHLSRLPWTRRGLRRIPGYPEDLTHPSQN